MIAGILDLIPNVGATIAGIIVALVALSVSLEALIAFGIVMAVYQQVENYILQPAIIGKAAQVSGFTVLASVLAFGALFGLIGAIVPCRSRRGPDRRGGADRPQKSSDRRRRTAAARLTHCSGRSADERQRAAGELHGVSAFVMGDSVSAAWVSRLTHRV